MEGTKDTYGYITQAYGIHHNHIIQTRSVVLCRIFDENVPLTIPAITTPEAYHMLKLILVSELQERDLPNRETEFDGASCK